MAILVVCPGCRKRFEVSDQFAGKTGPCPACKTTIKIPEKGEEVVIHGPAEAPPGKTKAGRPAPKPVARKDVAFKPLAAAAIAAVAVAVAVVAILGRDYFQEYWLARAIGLMLLSPPLVIGGYSILRNDELEPYRGRSLYLRVGIVSLVYVVLWAVFGQMEARGFPSEIWQWLVAAPPLFVVGALAAFACLDLDFGSGFFLYSFYVLLTVGLRWLAGMAWIWEAGGTPG
jgi:hypothetical protein